MIAKIGWYSDKDMGRFINIERHWTTRNEDGTYKDFGVKVIRHKASYCIWNDEKNDWDYFNVDCNCEVCQEVKKEKLNTKTMDPKFYQWLHELTTAGYTKKIILHRSDARMIQGYYQDGKTIDEALTLYIQFKEDREAKKNKI